MIDLSPYRYTGKGNFNLSKVKTDDQGVFENKEQALESLEKNIEIMIEQQSRLYAQGDYALLIILQAMDTAGKDGVIKHVMGGLNPQGAKVCSFKQPSFEELRHDYLWRASRCLPERGWIGIFNRSYYEEVLVVKIHDLIQNQNIPEALVDKGIWDNRYRQIQNFEEYLFQNGILPIKFFLHISKEEQKKRLLKRIENPSKNWKFSKADVEERKYWDDYQKCYEEAILKTGTEEAPWYVIPSDKKWYSRLLVSEAIIQALGTLKLKYPELTKKQLDDLEHSKKVLLGETPI